MLNLNLNAITATPTPVQTTAVNTAITTIEINEPYKIALAKEDKDKYQTVQEERYPFVVKAIKDLAPYWSSKMAPDVAAMVPNATVSMQVMDIYRPQISKLKMLLEFFTDANHIAGSQAYEFLKKFYAEAQGLKKRGIPGADALVDELSPLFATQGGAGEQPPTV